jgi:hypothetical protein
MSQVSQVEAAAPRRSSRKSKNRRSSQVDGERFTPLLTREQYTFSCMRSDRRGPRTFSAICAPGWKQS